MSVAPRPLALALVLPLAGLGAAADLGPPALTGADYARAQRSARDLVSLAAEIEGRIREAVAAHFEDSDIDVELLGSDEVKVLLKVHTREMAYPEVQQSLQLLARTINQEVLGKHYRDKHLSPSSALVVLNRREGSVPTSEAPDAEAPPRLARAEPPTGPSSEVARAATSPALRAGGRLAELARKLRERARRSRTVAPPAPIPGDPGPIAAVPGQVLPGHAGLGRPPVPVAPHAPQARALPEPLVLPGAEGLGALPKAPPPRTSLLEELARIDEPGLPISPRPPGGEAPQLEGEGLTFLLGEHLAKLGAPTEDEPGPEPEPEAEAMDPVTARVVAAVRAKAAIAPPVAALLAELTEVDEEAGAEGFAMDRPLPLPRAGPPPMQRHLHASVPVRFRPRRRPPPRRLLPRPPPKPRVDPVVARRKELERDIFASGGGRRVQVPLPAVETVRVPAPPPGPRVVDPPPPPFTPDSPQVQPPPRPLLGPGEAERVPRREPSWGGDLGPEDMDDLAGFSTDEAGFYLGDEDQEAFIEAVDEAWVSEAF
jgi:hypothetical protein